MPRSISLLNPLPHRLLCLGAHHSLALNLQTSLSPHFTYCAILTKIGPRRTYSLQNFELLLDTIYPPPEGVIIGGGFTEDEGEQMLLVEGRKDEEGQEIKFVKVLSGTLEEEGAEGLVRTIRGLLGEALGVEW